ncbi:hypothetical protein QW131_18405 [Roseibium salinum]|nr:hypothetical protein [Roseibium salinum]
MKGLEADRRWADILGLRHGLEREGYAPAAEGITQFGPHVCPGKPLCLDDLQALQFRQKGRNHGDRQAGFADDRRRCHGTVHVKRLCDKLVQEVLFQPGLLKAVRRGRRFDHAVSPGCVDE